jgi:hypothetical protein
LSYNQYGAFFVYLKDNIQSLPESYFINPSSASVQKIDLINRIDEIIRNASIDQYLPALQKLKDDIERKVKEWSSDPDRKALLAWVEQGPPQPSQAEVQFQAMTPTFPFT